MLHVDDELEIHLQGGERSTGGRKVYRVGEGLGLLGTRSWQIFRAANSLLQLPTKDCALPVVPSRSCLSTPRPTPLHAPPLSAQLDPLDYWSSTVAGGNKFK